MNLKPTGRAMPMAIAAGVLLVVFLICWGLVKHDMEEKWAAGLGWSHEFKFVGTFAILAAGAAYRLMCRIDRGGPELGREEWTLHASDFGGGQVANLQRGLERHGYVISIIGLSEAGEPAKAVRPTQPLVGARLGIRDRRHPWTGAGLSLLLPAPAAAGRKPGFGILTVTDQDPHDGTYAEMAQYLIAALSEWATDLRFKRLSSGLAPDQAAPLRASLPPSPRQLPAQSISSNRR